MRRVVDTDRMTQIKTDGKRRRMGERERDDRGRWWRQREGSSSECAFCSLMRESANEIAPRRLVTPPPPIVAAPERGDPSLLSTLFSLPSHARTVHVAPASSTRAHCVSIVSPRFSARGVFIAGARASVRNTGPGSRRNIRLSPCVAPDQSRIFVCALGRARMQLRAEAYP